MNKNQAKLNLKNVEYRYSDNAIEIYEELIERLYEDALDIDFKTVTLYELEDIMYQILDDYFIYDSDAFNYLMDNDHSDFKDAFELGYFNIAQIATFFLQEECENMIFTIFPDINDL